MKTLAPILAVFGILILFSVSLAQQDITPPVLESITFEPVTIDTSHAPQIITVTAHITDDLSGLDWAMAMFRHVNTGQHAEAHFYNEEDAQLWPHSWTENTERGTQYMARFELPRYAAYGEWRMDRVDLADNVGNYASYNYPKEQQNLSAEVWPARFNTFTFQNGEPVQLNFSLFIPTIQNIRR